MIFKRRKYPLPKFPPDVIPTFRGLVEELPDERVKELLPEVQRCVEHFKGLSTKYPRLDMQQVFLIASVCDELLQSYSSFSRKHKRLIIGAVRYFADSDDPVSETAFATGLDDDIKVLNHVLEEVGRTDLLIELL